MHASRFSLYMEFNKLIKKGIDFEFSPASHPIEKEEMPRFFFNLMICSSN